MQTRCSGENRGGGGIASGSYVRALVMVMGWQAIACQPFLLMRGETMKDYAKHFYKSKRWQDTRAAYIKSVGGLCEDCLKRGLYTPGVIVHHVRPITEKNITDPMITLAWDNLCLLCRQCHEKRHRTNTKRYWFDEYGRVISREV